MSSYYRDEALLLMAQGLAALALGEAKAAAGFFLRATAATQMAAALAAFERAFPGPRPSTMLG